MLLLTSAPPPPTWQAVLVSPDERLLWAILAAFGLSVVLGSWVRWRRSRRAEHALAPPETFG